MESTSPMQLTDWLLIIMVLLFIGQTQISLTKSGFNHFCNETTLLDRLLLHCVPRNEIARPRPNSYCTSMYLYAIYIFPGSVYILWLQQNRQTDPGNI
jgi:hypothetical protein